MIVGDWRKWLTEELYKQVNRVVNQKSDYKAPYYIQVQLQPEYRGPAAVCEETQETEMKAEKIYGIRLVCMNNKPIVPMLGTILFYVDNRRGLADLVYALPADKPHTTQDSDNEGPISTLVAEYASGLPLVFN